MSTRSAIVSFNGGKMEVGTADMTGGSAKITTTFSEIFFIGGTPVSAPAAERIGLFSGRTISGNIVSVYDASCSANISYVIVGR